MLPYTITGWGGWPTVEPQHSSRAHSGFFPSFVNLPCRDPFMSALPSSSVVSKGGCLLKWRLRQVQAYSGCALQFNFLYFPSESRTSHQALPSWPSCDVRHLLNMLTLVVVWALLPQPAHTRLSCISAGILFSRTAKKIRQWQMFSLLATATGRSCGSLRLCSRQQCKQADSQSKVKTGLFPMYTFFRDTGRKGN